MPSRQHCCVTLSLVLVLFAATQSSRAVTVPVSFSGPSQAFVGVSTGYGAIIAEGSGNAFNLKTGKIEPFNFTPPTSHAVTLIGGFALINSQPASFSPASFDVTPTTIDGINSLSLDLLNGSSIPIALNTITVTSNSAIGLLKSVTVDISGEISSLIFQQDAAAVVTPLGPNFGNFSAPGTAFLDLTNFVASLLGIVNVNFNDFNQSAPATLMGTYTISGPPGAAKITLDGTFGLAVPVSTEGVLQLGITNPLSLSVSSTVDFLTTIFINAGFHLEQDQLVVPEPGSLALMAIGLALCGTILCRRKVSA